MQTLFNTLRITKSHNRMIPNNLITYCFKCNRSIEVNKFEYFLSAWSYLLSDYIPWSSCHLLGQLECHIPGQQRKVDMWFDRSGHIKIRNFLGAHNIQEGKVLLKYLPAGEMIAGFMRKNLHGVLLSRFTNLLLGYENSTTVINCWFCSLKKQSQPSTCH